MNSFISKTRDVAFMARDFFRVVSGRDYFHEPAQLGAYFIDPRCYYYDFTPKIKWLGHVTGGVPILYIPGKSKTIEFPITIMQFGLGHIDHFFLTGNRKSLNSIWNVILWLNKSISEDGSYNNYFPEICSQYDFFSANSALAQGNALSFLTRVLKGNIYSHEHIPMIEGLIKKIVSNMILPLEKGGTLLRFDGEVYLCELCRKDNYVVLNGWVYGIFGLIDYLNRFEDRNVENILSETLLSLDKKIEVFIDSGGWSIYDNKGRICSPIYNDLHVVLIDALARLTGSNSLHQVLYKLKAAQTTINRVKFSVKKAVEKMRDHYLYVTHH